MGATVSATTGSLAAGAAPPAGGNFLDVLEEVLAEGGRFAGPIALLADGAMSAPGTRSGGVSGERGLNWSYQDPADGITLSVSGANGQQFKFATLHVEAGGVLADEQGQRAGKLNADGSVTVDDAWAQVRAEADENTACQKTPDSTPFGQRGLDLPPELQSNSFVARGNAYASDPKLAEAGLPLSNAAQPSSDCAAWQAHHLMPLKQVSENRDLFEAAAKDGWRMDEPPNVIGLPHNVAAQQRLSAVGSPRPLHDNAHQNNYSNGVQRRLDDVRTKLRQSQLPVGSAAYNHLARQLIEQLQSEERQGILNMGAGRLTMADPSATEQAA